MNTLNLHAPESWSDVSQKQLRTLLKVMASFSHSASFNDPHSADDHSTRTVTKVAAYCLFYWNNIKVKMPYGDGWLIADGKSEYVVTAQVVAAAAMRLSWIGELPASPVRLERIDGADAVDASLDDSFSFDDWLSCETLWQGYLVVNDNSCLRLMAEILYRKPGIKLKDYELLSIFYWWTGVKSECERLYPDFFRPAPVNTAVNPDPEVLRHNIDAQIRALTKGDISKESVILNLPAHRALTELNALAREYEELNRKYPSK